MSDLGQRLRNAIIWVCLIGGLTLGMMAARGMPRSDAMAFLGGCQ